MKVLKPNTDCEVIFEVFANQQKCPEFVLPEAEVDQSVPVCFIAVPDDATITIMGKFTGTTLHGRVDVLADGTFVAGRVIEGDNNRRAEEPALKYYDGRRFEFRSFVNVPDVNDHRQRLKPKVVEGNLVTKKLDRETQAQILHGDESASGVGVGSIAIVISLSQKAPDVHAVQGMPAYTDLTLGDWRNDVSNVTDSGIPADYELGMEIFTDANPVKDKKATLHWRDVNAKRPGNEPWTTLVFYFRSQDTIHKANCVPLLEDKNLFPADGSFVRMNARGDMRINEDGSPWAPPPPVEKKTLGVGKPLLLPGSGIAPLQQQSSVRGTSVEDSTMDSASATEPEKTNKTRDASKANAGDGTQPLRPTPNLGTNSLRPREPKKPRVSFATPLSTNIASTSSPAAERDAFLDDLATPYLPAGYTSRLAARASAVNRTASPTQLPPWATSQSAGSPERLTSPSRHMGPRGAYSTPSGARVARPPLPKAPPAQDLTSQTTSLHKSLTQPLRLQRAESQISTDKPGCSPTASDIPSSSTPKRPRVEEAQAQLEAKRQRKEALLKMADDEKRQREEQKRSWAESEDKKRRQAEEAKQALAAEDAEIEALRREADAEDAEMAELEAQQEHDREEWEALVQARGMGGGDVA